MRRFMLVLGGVLVVLAACASPAAAGTSFTARSLRTPSATHTLGTSLTARSLRTPSATHTLGAGCVPAAEATYRHSFDGGAGQATVTAVRPLCSGQSQTFTLLSYTAPSSTFAYPQFVYDQAQATIDARHGSVQLAVTVPPCYFQVDLVFGGDVHTEVSNADSNYGNLILGAPSGTGSRARGPYAGDADGTAPCAPKPVVTYRNACNGTFTATLSNDASANVDAVFLIAGHRLRVAPGHSIAAQRHTGTLTIRDNTFTTTIGSWERPPTGCDPASSAVVPPSAPPVPAAPATTPPPSPAPVFSATDAEDAAGTPLPVAPNGSSSPPAALRTTGTSFSSAAVIALGVLLMGGGLIILFRVLRGFRRP